MHEDFICMNGYEMKTLDEWLEGLREERYVTPAKQGMESNCE